MSNIVLDFSSAPETTAVYLLVLGGAFAGALLMTVAVIALEVYMKK